MKKLLCVLLVLVMVLGLASGLAEGEKEYYGGYTDTIDATIVVYQRTGQGDAENIWWWEFCRQYFGINFTVTQTTDGGTFRSTAFSTGDMPDVWYQLFLGSSVVVEQGVQNGNLIPLDDYITPEIMPNLSRIYEAYPQYKTTITCPDGHIYCLGAINNGNDSLMTFYINQRWLDEAGLEVPTTLDEFTEVMAAFKAREELPENEGKTIVPLTGDLGNQPRYIANAFGWITDSAGYLTTIALDDVDGTPCFIYADEERFPEFMAVMKDYIAKGYFSADVFDDQYAGNQTAQQKAEDLTGFDQNLSNAINSKEWVCAIPLTSEWNDEPAIARTYNSVNCQSFAISKTCAPEKVERLMKWVDWLYDYDNYLLAHDGPTIDQPEYFYGMLKSGCIPYKNIKTGLFSKTSLEVLDGTYSNWTNYTRGCIEGIIGGYVGLSIDMWGEATRPYNPQTWSNNKDVNVLPYLVDCYPNIRFFDADTNARITELATEINKYVNEQYVAFISGEKELSQENLDEYFATLKDLGYEEYVQYFIDYYDNYKNS